MLVKLRPIRASKLQYIYRRCITFNASDNDDTKSRKPLESNFVFRVYQELGKKSQDRESQESVLLQTNALEEEINSTSSYFRSHDRPSHRLFGIYYKMAQSEISCFLSRGFGCINHLMHPLIDEELPLLHETINGIFTKQIEFDFAKYMQNSQIILNLDSGHYRDENTLSISENVSIWLPPIYKPTIYHQQYSMIRNIGQNIKELKGNYFEYRGLSIAKQLFVHLIRSNQIENEMVLLSDDILIIDAHNFLESLETETIRFPTPQLVSICDIKAEEHNKEHLICVLAIQNSILTLKRREFDPNNIPPNIPLSGGSVLFVDPNIYQQILYWRRTNDPATFFVNVYGEKVN